MSAAEHSDPQVQAIRKILAERSQSSGKSSRLQEREQVSARARALDLFEPKGDSR